MTQITRININALNNGNYYQFIESIVAISQSESAVQVVLADLISDLESLKTSFKKEQLNAETAQIAEADELRDRAFSKIGKMVEAYLLDDRTPANQAAAETVAAVIARYGREMIRFDYNKESAYLTNFIKDLQDNAQSAIDALGLAEDVAYLKTRNDGFIELYARRGDAAQELANIQPFSKLRKQVNQHYNAFIVYVESLYRVDKTLAPQIETLIGRINVEIEKYKLLLSKPGEKKAETPVA